MTASTPLEGHGRPHRVFLIGMMGAGKTTTGHALAARLGWPYLDSDEEILRSTGRTVPEIWKADGEAAFRAEEARVLAQAATSDGPLIVAVAGGAVLDPSNRAVLRKAGLIVWLRAEVSTLADRVGDGHGRPLLEAGAAEVLARLTPERENVYRELADVRVEVDGRTPGEVVDAVMAAMTAAAVRQEG